MGSCKRSILLPFLALLIGSSLVCAAVPAFADPGDAAGDLPADSADDPVIPYGIWVSGVQVTTANAGDVLGNGGSVSFEGDTATLTLTDATIFVSEVDESDAAGIYNEDLFEEGLTISLVGDNQIVMPWYGADRDRIIGICSRESGITIEGEGSLSISLSGGAGNYLYGLWLDNGSGSDELTIDGVSLSMDLTSRPGGADAGAEGLFTWHRTAIIDSDIEIGISADAGVIGICGFKDLTLEGSTVDISVDPSRTIADYCYGVRLDSNTLTLTGSSTLTVSSGQVAPGGESCGIFFLCGLFAFGPGAICVEDGSSLRAQALCTLWGGAGSYVGSSFEDSGLVLDVSEDSLLELAGSTQALSGDYLGNLSEMMEQGILTSGAADGYGAKGWDGEADLLGADVRYLRMPGESMDLTIDFGAGHEDFVLEYYGPDGDYSTSGKYRTLGSKVIIPVCKGMTPAGAAQQADIPEEMVEQVDGGLLFSGYLALHTMDAYGSLEDLEQERVESGHIPSEDGVLLHALWFTPIESVAMTLEAPVAGTVVEVIRNDEYGFIEDQVPGPLFTCSGDASLADGSWRSSCWLAGVPDDIWGGFDYLDATIQPGQAYWARATLSPAFGHFFPDAGDDQGSYDGCITVNGQAPGKVLQYPGEYGTLYVLASVAAIGDPVPRSFQRLAGSDRYSTGAAIAGTYGAQGGTVILATGSNFPDALCASALAGKEHAPILMTASTSLSPATAATLAAIKPEHIIVIGGTGAVSGGVLQAACAAAGIPCDYEHTERFSGANRFETGLQVFQRGRLFSDTCIIATGGNFADALSISPYAYATATPIFLVDPKTLLLDEETADALEMEFFSRIIIVGGTGVVSDGVAEQLGVDSSDVVRLAGQSRYGTSLAIANWEMGLDTDAAFGPEKVLGVGNISLATGANFPDALTGGALCGKKRSVLVLVGEKEADYQGALELVGARPYSIKQGFILGGTGAVSDALKARFDSVLV